MKDTLVISGGGIRGICALGLLQKLFEAHHLDHINTFIGTSAGALINLLLVIGYYPVDILNIFLGIDFNLIMKYDVNTIFNEHCIGLFTQSTIIYIIQKMMIGKGINLDITFQELFDKTQKTLIMTGVCINTNQCEYFSYKTFPDMKVLTAIKITSCVPVMFKPISFDNKLWIDGGVIDNYPIAYATTDCDKIIGILLNDNSTDVINFDSTFQYLFQIFKCCMKKLTVCDTKYDAVTIKVCCVQSYSWSITNDEKNQLYNLGYNLDYSTVSL